MNRSEDGTISLSLCACVCVTWVWVFVVCVSAHTLSVDWKIGLQQAVGRGDN